MFSRVKAIMLINVSWFYWDVVIHYTETEAVCVSFCKNVCTQLRCNHFWNWRFFFFNGTYQTFLGRIIISIIIGLYGSIFSCMLDKNLLQNIKQTEWLSNSAQCLIFVWNSWHSQSNLSWFCLRVQRLKKLDIVQSCYIFQDEYVWKRQEAAPQFWKNVAEIESVLWRLARRQETTVRFLKRISLWSSL